ncbi:MAG: hypothetical protein KJO55_02825 [Gammaproteobacteria bacterium]|nr:hypothetical protein [Gammaproteobacteria bacterium]NND59897.1 hypothetical protein [Gammaproteobacteria bacterium]
MIARFLELGVATERILDSIGFFEDLGFRQLATGDIWQHPYAVVSDGGICIGLHGTELMSPILTFVLPDLAAEVNELRSRGMRIRHARTGDDDFNEIVFTEPDQHCLRLIEARTFSPPHFDENSSLCGVFSEITVPVRDLEVATPSWQRLGFELLESTTDPYPHAWIRGNGIVIGLHQSRDIDQLSLSFKCDTTGLSALRDRGIEFIDDGPPGVNLVRSPDGLPILLHGN